MNTPTSTLPKDGSYIDWPAIVAGSVVAVAIAMLLATFGAALGLSSITLDGSDESPTFELILTALWLVLTLTAAYLAGGYIAGRMRRRLEIGRDDEVTTRDGINGLVVWGLGTILSAVLLTNVISFAANTAGAVVSGAGEAVGTVAQTVGDVAGSAAAGLATVAGAAIPDAAVEDPTEYLSNQLLRPTEVDPTGLDPEQLAQQATSIVANVFRTGEVSDEDRAYLASAVAASTELSQQQAGARVDQVIADVQLARDEAAAAVEAAEAEAQELADQAEAAAIEAARVARNAGILTAFVFAAAALISAVAAFSAAIHGGRDRDEGRTTYGLRYHG